MGPLLPLELAGDPLGSALPPGAFDVALDLLRCGV
jgi:hypothetical protein